MIKSIKKRIKVENFFAHLNTFRRINTRYDKNHLYFELYSVIMAEFLLVVLNLLYFVGYLSQNIFLNAPNLYLKYILNNYPKQ